MSLKNKIAMTASAIALVGATSLTAMEVQDGMETNADIATSAMSVANLSTLVAAVDAAGLTKTLMGEGPFTVFAPIDSAFEGVPVATLMMEENREMLTNILTSHVVAGSYTEFQLEEMIGQQADDDEFTFIETLSGERLRVAALPGDGVLLFDGEGNAIEVITSDITATNGVVHAIDKVIMPSS